MTRTLAAFFAGVSVAFLGVGAAALGFVRRKF